MVETQLQQGKIDEAMITAERAAMANLADVDAQELFIDLLLEVGFGRRAERIYQERMAVDPTNPVAHYLVGRAAVTADGAQKAYEHALRLDPDYARAHMGLAAVNEANGDLPDAAKAYFRAVNLDSSLAEAWMGFVRAELVLGNRTDALKAAQEGIRHVPGEAGLYLTVATLSPASAHAVLTSGAAAVDDPRIYAALAEVLLEQGDADGALVRARHALAVDPTLRDAIRTRLFAEAVTSGVLDIAGYKRLVAMRSHQEADPAGAAAAYDQLIADYPKCPLPLLARSQLRRGLGDLQGAVDDSGQAAVLAPYLVEVAASHGLLLLEAGQPAEARQFLRVASEARPWDASLGLGFAASHSQAGDPDSAVTILQVLRQLHPYDVRVVLNLGQALLDTRQPESAYLLLRDALKVLPDQRLGVALVFAAREAGHYGEAAALLEQLGAQTGRQTLLDEAARLRELERGG